MLQLSQATIVGLGLDLVLAKQRRLLMNSLICLAHSYHVVVTAVMYQNITVWEVTAAVPTSCFRVLFNQMTDL